MNRFHVRAEFRRDDRSAPWILAGVKVEEIWFRPVHPGIEPVSGRLPETGLVGWTSLPVILAPDVDGAAEAAFAIVRDRWPGSVRAEVPFARGR